MEKCAFIDIFTTQNELYGKNNCPIQFATESYFINEIFNIDTFIRNDNFNVFNIISDEEISMAGYINSGYTTEDIRTSDYNGYELSEALEKIYDILCDYRNNGVYIVGFNHVNYDLEILNRHFKRILNKEPIVFGKDILIDIMKWCEAEFPITKIGNYTMDSCWAYCYKNMDKYHEMKNLKSTVTDLKITKLLMIYLFKVSSLFNTESLSNVVSHIDEKLRKNDIFNFGKYKGLEIRKVFEIDKQYLNWILKNKDMEKMNPYLVEYIKDMYNDLNNG